MNWYAVVYVGNYSSRIKKVHRDLAEASQAARAHLARGCGYARVLRCKTRNEARGALFSSPLPIALDLVKKAA